MQARRRWSASKNRAVDFLAINLVPHSRYQTSIRQTLVMLVMHLSLVRLNHEQRSDKSVACWGFECARRSDEDPSEQARLDPSAGHANAPRTAEDRCCRDEKRKQRVYHRSTEGAHDVLQEVSASRTEDLQRHFWADETLRLDEVGIRIVPRAGWPALHRTINSCRGGAALCSAFALRNRGQGLAHDDVDASALRDCVGLFL
ncbi:hypothetical protein JH26_08215 [Microvirga sp. BSC39]|nr:hypothetical protein JH26_08215 [Microvirga sp. BSC39]